MPEMPGQRITKKNSTIPYRDSGLGLFICRIISKQEATGYHHSSLGFADLTKKRHKTKMCGERVTCGSFSKAGEQVT